MTTRYENLQIRLWFDSAMVVGGSPTVFLSTLYEIARIPLFCPLA